MSENLLKKSLKDTKKIRNSGKRVYITRNR